MSGGHFSTSPYQIVQIADDIAELIQSNDDESKDEYGDTIGRHYPPEVIEKFKEASHTLRQAGAMCQRVDYLVSDDDGVQSFMRRWTEEVPPGWPEIITNNTMPHNSEAWPACSGNPACCPENAGYGCCKPNPPPTERDDETVPENVVSIFSEPTAL
jgi:hypothetical protein